MGNKERKLKKFKALLNISKLRNGGDADGCVFHTNIRHYAEQSGINTKRESVRKIFDAFDNMPNSGAWHPADAVYDLVEAFYEG